MKTDRELLEAAAKAAGYWSVEFNCPDKVPTAWDPLADDGDALRLAVQLGLRVETGRCWVSEYGPMYGEDVLPCPYAATRRAIVSAAAAMPAAPAVGAA